MLEKWVGRGKGTAVKAKPGAIRRLIEQRFSLNVKLKLCDIQMGLHLEKQRWKSIDVECFMPKQVFQCVKEYI